MPFSKFSFFPWTYEKENGTSSNKMFWENMHLKFLQRKGDLTIVEKSHFVICVKQLKVLFEIILETKIILNDTYSCLKQVAKWCF
jgi:hypothetical protein